MAVYKNLRPTSIVLAPLIAVGAASVIYYYFAEPRSGVLGLLENGTNGDLRCINPIKDFGDTEESRVSHTFIIENTSNKAIRVDRIGKSCGCLELKISKSILEPGSSTKLEVATEVSSSHPGDRTKFAHEAYVHGRDADDNDAVVVLKITGTYIPPLYWIGRQVIINPPAQFGEHFSGEFDIYLNKDRGIDVQKVRCSGEFPFEASVKSRGPSKDAGIERVTIGISGIFREGPMPRVGEVVIDTTSLAMPSARRSVVMVPAKEDRLIPRPSVLAFGVLECGVHAVKTVNFSFSGESPYTMKVVGCSPDYVKAAVLDDSDGSEMKVECEVDTTALSGRIDGSLVAEVDHGGKRETYTIPISGFVRAAK